MSLLGHTDLTLYEGGGDVPLGTHIDLTLLSLYEGGGDVTLRTHRLDFTYMKVDVMSLLGLHTVHRLDFLLRWM